MNRNLNLPTGTLNKTKAEDMAPFQGGMGRDPRDSAEQPSGVTIDRGPQKNLYLDGQTGANELAQQGIINVNNVKPSGMGGRLGYKGLNEVQNQTGPDGRTVGFALDPNIYPDLDGAYMQQQAL